MFQVNITERWSTPSRRRSSPTTTSTPGSTPRSISRSRTTRRASRTRQYNVNNYQWQIVNLARTTLRNIIGTLTLKSANSERGKINTELQQTLREETAQLGHRDRPHRAQGDRSAQGRPGDDEQGRQGREREDRRHRLRHRDRDHGRRRSGGPRSRRPKGIRQAKILAGRGRGPGHQAGQRGGRPVLRRQRPAPAAARDASRRRWRTTPRSSSRPTPSWSTSSATWPACCR